MGFNWVFYYFIVVVNVKVNEKVNYFIKKICYFKKGVYICI